MKSKSTHEQILGIINKQKKGNLATLVQQIKNEIPEIGWDKIILNNLKIMGTNIYFPKNEEIEKENLYDETIKWKITKNGQENWNDIYKKPNFLKHTIYSFFDYILGLRGV